MTKQEKLEENKQKAIEISREYRLCSSEFYSGVYEGALIALNSESIDLKIIDKATK